MDPLFSRKTMDELSKERITLIREIDHFSLSVETKSTYADVSIGYLLSEYGDNIMYRCRINFYKDIVSFEKNEPPFGFKGINGGSVRDLVNQAIEAIKKHK